ncbi:MupG family TIM beta-alpha barrel fold protein [Paraliobacillus sp. JSM ZJ581]|uniref:MupG family TIM beta-alpha barrel fold protein n=1 Tax=Paraliobacillus sp. JSM ZJ581 TaxID=3342118 RepID=UPI0035A94A35
MLKPLGFSVYVSTFEKQIPMLKEVKGTNSYVFTSFHIEEEVDTNYVSKAREMCLWLHQHDFQIIADVSPKTLRIFGVADVLSLMKELYVSVLRLDYGFSKQELKQFAQTTPIALNASTIDITDPYLVEANELYAMHNFYPRPETGLDLDLFQSINQIVSQKQSVNLIAFIPGDAALRGPIYEGLPTLEKHRNCPPYVAYLDLIKNSVVNQVFIGDVLLSNEQLQMIEAYRSGEIITIPVTFEEENSHLYNQVFTIRIDSPKSLMRLQESREYASQGEIIEPHQCFDRFRGTITIDNKRYKRYSGEIQIMRENHIRDERVNVIGQIADAYIPIVDCIKNGDKIRFVKM